MFSDVHAAGQRMLSLVNNLLDLSRLESTVGEIQLVSADIAPPLRAVVQELMQMALDRSLTVAVQAAPGPLWASADAGRLQQVLRNVLANAIRFAPEGSEIALDWRRDGADSLLISLRDHGPGIPADELESIFEAFVQSTRTKDGSGGTGLGLAICRKIMAAHHGSISARNHSDGGAVFDIRLPAGRAPAAVSADAAVSAA
jgi:signal transduction histidine kinase